jgi:hypothetical protein
MNVRLIQSWYRCTRQIVFSLVVSLTATTSAALADEYLTTCNYNDELCGWVDIEAESQAAKIETSKTDPNELEPSLDPSLLATLATAFGATTGVSFNAIVEPFAMVGPTVKDSLNMVQTLDQWWEFAVDYAEQLQANETEEAIDAIATLEPIDVESYGPSVLIRSESSSDEVDHPVTGIKVTPIDNLVGSAPMIVTIDEPYLSYDLSAADLRLRSVFPISTQPFCVRSRAAGWNPVPMWTEFDSLELGNASEEPLADPVDRWMIASWVEQMISITDALSHSESTIRQRTSPEQLGRQWANLVARSNQVVVQTTELIATYWPEPVAKPSAAGKALLTRAGIVTERSPEGAPATQIAELNTGGLVR